MSDESDTPRTDAACAAPEPIYPRLAHFARQLERELTAAQKDAERYRWLRDGYRGCKLPDFPIAKGIDTLNTYWDKELDAAIDAAIAAEESNPPA